MRVVNDYRFKTGTKIPFSDLPDKIRDFFDETRTNYGTFLYYFDDIIYDQRDITGWGCSKLLKDRPDIGKINRFDGKNINFPDHLWVSNIKEYSGNAEAKLLPFMKKIHKFYGMADNDLYFYDADFFGEPIPWERDLTRVNEKYSANKMPADDSYLMNEQPFGSGVRIHRDCLDTYLILSADILKENAVYDPDPLAEIMKKCLSGIKYQKSQKILFSKEESEEIEKTDKKAARVLKDIQSHYNKIFPSVDRQNREASNYSLAPFLKRASKKRGYTYHNVFAGHYFLEKRMDNGPVICLTADSGPSRFSVDFDISVRGVGYDRVVFSTMQTPTDQMSFELCASIFFTVADDFENRFYPELSKFYSAVPDWFVTNKF